MKMPRYALGWLALVLLCSPVLASTQATEALLARGDQLWKEGKLEDAQQSFKTALLAEPRSTEIQMKLGGLQLSNNDFAASIQTYKNVISLDGRNVRAWLGLGFSYLHTGKSSLSMAAFDEAIRLDPSKKVALQPVMDKLLKP